LTTNPSFRFILRGWVGSDRRPCIFSIDFIIRLPGDSGAFGPSRPLRHAETSPKTPKAVRITATPAAGSKSLRQDRFPFASAKRKLLLEPCGQGDVTAFAGAAWCIHSGEQVMSKCKNPPT
jgi:hypothetical protein